MIRLGRMDTLDGRLDVWQELPCSGMPNPGAEDEAPRKFLRVTTGQMPEVQPFGPTTARYGLARLEDYPRGGLTTVMTFGAARQPFSMWRGLPLGMDLVLTLAGDITEVAEMLKAAVLEGHRRSLSKDDRRRLVEANGVWAPGYPPHLLFTDVVSATPDLMVQKKFGERYVSFLSAIPIDDLELREYDRDVPGFIRGLEDRVEYYPRSSP